MAYTNAQSAWHYCMMAVTDARLYRLEDRCARPHRGAAIVVDVDADKCLDGILEQAPSIGRLGPSEPCASDYHTGVYVTPVAL